MDRSLKATKPFYRKHVLIGGHMAHWYRGAGLLSRSLFIGVVLALIALVAYSLLARSRRMAYAGERIAPRTPTPLIDAETTGIPAIDAAQPPQTETHTATFALG
jgi:hypothetical protein